MPPVLVSACLLGVRCRYDGGSRPDAALLDLLAPESIHAIPVCPEQLGGLSTPRAPAEIRGGDGRDVLGGRARVINQVGVDVTDHYIRGAREVFRLAQRFGCTRACLKTKSPACGPRSIKRGAETVPGLGVAAALLDENGLELIPVVGE
jgi:uncharacterized protein YbbK (DUF523 family)